MTTSNTYKINITGSEVRHLITGVDYIITISSSHNDQLYSIEISSSYNPPILALLLGKEDILKIKSMLNSLL